MKTRSMVAEWPHAVNMCILIFMILSFSSSPFQTLQKAANTVTSLKNVATNNDTYIVYIEEGRYWITSTITIPRPNRYNDASSRVIWKPWNENHQVVITGGVPLPVKLWSLVTEYNNPQVFDMLPPSARGKVLQLNLTQAGLFKSQLIPLNRTGFYSGIQASNELFYKGKAFYWARYPNKLPDETESFLKISFTNGGNRVDFDASKSENRNKWPLEKRPFAFGFWYYDWAEGIEDLQNITSNGTFHFVQSTITYGVQKNQRFFLLNFLSELDQEGEYIFKMR
ncbi:hypothetical protein C9374_004077 [Naegleria lovaniensis]|uniref:Uncharacterized protein n=1 Tax=Naegleria lovaniensis TaxID=51637 RepID=A0AA88KP76_NAELO|nr:uncharacterized protein C9374_004077 [Naegleria lovaniensis]KAG2383406.1 hypothetical protein C9374_004077 [Naegleria lovaniensis]